jgi:MFS transporter, OFA family, oxalate/formate antiporter
MASASVHVGGGSDSRPVGRHRPLNRWLQLVAGVVGMMAIAGVLYVWPLLRSARGGSLTQELAATENAFAAFIFTETIFVPLEAWLGERIPRWLLVGAGVVLVLMGAFAGAAAVGTRAKVVWYVLGGAGAGLAYGGTIAKALRSFTDRKALCVGVTAAACAGVIVLAAGANLALSSPSAMPLLVVLGAAQAAVILVATLFILEPPPPGPPPDWQA